MIKYVIVAAAALIVGVLLGIVLQKSKEKKAEMTIADAEAKALQIENDAHKRAESKTKEMLLEAKEEILRSRNEYEKELYTIMAEIKKEAQPDTLDVHHQIAVVAAVGRKMAFRPGISGKIFAALGESGINIRMINQGPDELNIIFGVDNKDFNEAIRVLYNRFVTK